MILLGFVLVLSRFTFSVVRSVQDSFCDDFIKALVCVGDSQISSQVTDSQPVY
jgi:hypothetical protein